MDVSSVPREVPGLRRDILRSHVAVNGQSDGKHS